MRNFTESSPIDYCFDSKTCPLIKIDSKRNITYYNSVREKLEALKNRKKSDKFIISWSGKWSTDIFDVTEKDIEDAIISVL